MTPIMKAIIERRSLGKRVRLYVNGKKVDDAVHYGDMDEIKQWIRAEASSRGAKYVEA